MRRQKCDVVRRHMDVAISTSGMRRRLTLYERRIIDVGSRQICDVGATSLVGRDLLRPKCDVLCRVGQDPYIIQYRATCLQKFLGFPRFFAPRYSF